MHFGSFRYARFMKKVLGVFSRFFVQKRSCLPWISDAFWKSSACKVCRKSSGRRSTIYVFKIEAVFCELQTHFGSSRFVRFMKNVQGALSRFVRTKMKLLAVKFRRNSEVLRLQSLQTNFWTNFHDWCIPKRSCLLWSSHTFWKLSACKFYRKRCGRNFTICACKNEAVCCVVQTHFGRFLLVVRLIKKLWAHFHNLCVAQTNILDFNIF